MKPAYILASYRTPGCRANKGKFRDMRPDDLAAIAIKGLLERTGIDPATVDDVYLGCAFPEAEQGMNVGRVAAMKAGLPVEVPGQTINRFCSSGLQSIASAAERIMLGFDDCIIAGGVESMSSVPLGGLKYSANPGLAVNWPEAYSSMGITAELVAERYQISRQAMDEFATESNRRAADAISQGRFKDEIIPVQVPQRRGDPIIFDTDEFPRFGTTIEKLGKLKPAFRKDGTTTAGNSSGINDGAAALIIMSADKAFKMGIRPMAKIIGYDYEGCEPELMGTGPIYAVRSAINKVREELGKDIDLVELNEAFAAQSIACLKDLNLDPDIVNVNGGAIALGHPIGCSGARVLTTLLYEMEKRDAKVGLAALCIGGGMGIATIVEREWYY